MYNAVLLVSNVMSHILTCSVCTSPGDEHKLKRFSIDTALPYRHKAMNHGNNEPPQFRLHHQVSEEVTVPDKLVICSLMKGQLHEVGPGLCEVMLPLQREGEIIGVGEIEPRCGQNPLHHGQVLLVVPFLCT